VKLVDSLQIGFLDVIETHCADLGPEIALQVDIHVPDDRASQNPYGLTADRLRRLRQNFPGIAFRANIRDVGGDGFDLFLVYF
jgi:hypothetical protein